MAIWIYSPLLTWPTKSIFNTSSGGGETYTVSDSIVINPSNPAFSNSRPENDEAVLTIKKDGEAEILNKPPGGNWADLPLQSYMLAGGPLLLENGQNASMLTNSFNTRRHPRTVAGIKGDSLFLLTVDGRTPPAAGMSTLELAKILGSLGCQTAINLDGGGSTTMWIDEQTTNGIVSYPSDNGAFDHFGERPCANAIIINAVSTSSTNSLKEEPQVDFNLYPNPANNYVILKWGNLLPSQPNRVELIDEQGKVISIQDNFEGNRLKVNTSSLSPGSYSLKIQLLDKILVKPFLKVSN